MAGLNVNDPVTLRQAINSKNIISGDTIRVRGGRYRGSWILNVGGRSDAPVSIRPYDNEPVILDGEVDFAKPFAHLYDMEITDSDPDRTVAGETTGVSINQVGCKLIGCHIHDIHSSGANWFGSGEGEISECWIHDNGGRWPDGSGWGHGIYSHNNGGGARLIARNLMGNNFGRYSIHVYSADNNYLRDYTVEDNVINGDPAICGGGLGLRNYVCQRNIQFGDYWYQGRYSIQASDGGLIQDNLFIHLSDYSVQSTFDNLTEQNNTVWGGEPSNRPGYTVEPEPREWEEFIPFTLSERWSGIQVTLSDGVFDAKVVERA